ncbi:hypothetical protein BX666DRAFT_2030030 [Dichotomocladium elegans]|nr:hypothetical protein BX666DRAFT_2030030 [Dichotomocladium elegans]
MPDRTPLVDSPRIFAVERLTIKERLSRLFIPNRDTVPVLFSEEKGNLTSVTRRRCYRPQSAVAPTLVHCHSAFSVRTAMSSLAELTDDDDDDDDDESDVSYMEDDEDDEDACQPQQKVAYSFSLPPASIAAAQAARTRRFHTRASRITTRHPLA